MLQAYSPQAGCADFYDRVWAMVLDQLGRAEAPSMGHDPAVVHAANHQT
jgi:hypothetical protein